MRSNIMGYRQDLLLKYELDLTDVLLLDYVSNACVSPSMKKTHDENDQPYVWLQHKKIREDLPIISLKEDALKKRIHTLVDKGLLKTIIKTDITRGRRAYYTITEECERLKMTDQVYSDTLESDDQGDLNTLESARPSVSKYPSDNKLISDNKLDIDNSIKSNPIQSEEIDNFVNDYNEICKSLPKCCKLTKERRKAIAHIIKKFKKEEILQVFNKLEQSDFCTGRNGRGWKADFDFILRENKFVSILEGKYDNSTPSATFIGGKDKFGEFGQVHTGGIKGEITNEQF